MREREGLEIVGLHSHVGSQIMDVEPLRLTGVYSSPRYAVTYPNGDRVQQITLCYACRIASGQLRPETAEVVELALYAPDTLPPMQVDSQQMLAAIDALLRRAIEASPEGGTPSAGEFLYSSGFKGRWIDCSTERRLSIITSKNYL